MESTPVKLVTVIFASATIPFCFAALDETEKDMANRDGIAGIKTYYITGIGFDRDDRSAFGFILIIGIAALFHAEFTVNGIFGGNFVVPSETVKT